jgi:hypothetical protein
MRGLRGDTSVMPTKAGIQTWPHMLRPWIPPVTGTEDLILSDAAR